MHLTLVVVPWTARTEEAGGRHGRARISAADGGEVEDAGDGFGVLRADSWHGVGRHGEAERTAVLACLEAAGFCRGRARRAAEGPHTGEHDLLDPEPPGKPSTIMNKLNNISII